MARQLKVYLTSIGFYELAVAAPSMKAATEAWGATPDIFSRGFAGETNDPKIVKAALTSPGVVLRRPVGSHGTFSEHAALPKAPAKDTKTSPPHSEAAASRKEKSEGSANDNRKAVAALKQDQARQERDRAKLEAEREKQRQQRSKAVAAANAAFEKAKASHDKAVQSLHQRQQELDRDSAREEARWETEQRRHRAALKTLEA